MKWMIHLVLAFCATLLFLPRCSTGLFSDILNSDLTTFLQNDYYGALGLPKSATAKEIKAAYRKLSLEYHPDRNPDADPQRFLDIAAAHEVLSKPSKKERYDLFLYECPARLRPVYGQRRNDSAIFFATCAFVVTILLISIAQNQQFKRERKRALESTLFKDALDAAVESGMTEEEFMEIFKNANPELERTWKDTLGSRMVAFFRRKIFGAPKDIVDPPQSCNLDTQNSVLSDNNQITGETNGEEEFVPPPLPEDMSPEELKKYQKKVKRLKKAFEERKRSDAARRAKAQRRHQADLARDAQREKLRQEQILQQEHEERERMLSLARQNRKRQINKDLDTTLLAKLLDAPGVTQLLRSKGLVGMTEKHDPKELENILGDVKEYLVSLVDTSMLDEEEFWQKVFDFEFAELDAQKRLAAEREQEEYEAEERRRIQMLKGEIVDNNNSDYTSEQDEFIDPEWEAELLAMDAAKKAKKDLMKKNKAESGNTVAAKGKAPQGKKERRR